MKIKSFNSDLSLVWLKIKLDIMTGLFRNKQAGKEFEQTPSRSSRQSKGTTPSTSTRRRSPAKTFNDTIMNNYDKYCSLPKKIRDHLSFTQFMGVPVEDDLMFSSPRHQPRTKQESIESKGSKGRGADMMFTNEIGRKLFEDFERHLDPIGASLVGYNAVPSFLVEAVKEEFVTSSNTQDIHERFDEFSDCPKTDFESAIDEEHEVEMDSVSLDLFVTLLPLLNWEDHEESRNLMVCSESKDLSPQYDHNSEVHNSSDVTSLPQDMTASGHEENKELHSTFAGAYGTSMGYADANNTTHHKSDFVYFGAAGIKHCQKLNEDWLHRAAQARHHLQKDKERRNRLDDTRIQRESSIRSLFLPREEKDSEDILNGNKNQFDFLSLISNSPLSNESNLKPCIENIQVGKTSCEVDELLGGIHSGPATEGLSMLQNKNIYYSFVDLSPLSYDRAAMYLLIGDSVFLDVTVGYEDQHVRDYIWCMAKQYIYLASSNEDILTCGEIGQVAAADQSFWRGFHHTLLVGNCLIDGSISTLQIGGIYGFNWSETLS